MIFELIYSEPRLFCYEENASKKGKEESKMSKNDKKRKMKRWNAVPFICIAIWLLGLPIGAFAETFSDKIDIGVLGPMKYVQGNHHWAAATIAAEEINAAGGVMVGKKRYELKLLKADSNEIANVTDAVNAMERIISNNKVNFIVGAFRSEATLAMMEVMADHRTIFLSCGPSSPDLAEQVKKNYNRYKYWFRGGPANTTASMPTAFMTANMAAEAVRKELKIEKPKVAIMADKALYCEPAVSMLQEQLPKLGMEIVGVWRPSFTASSVMSELTAIKAAGAHIIFTYAAGQAGIAYSNQAGELQIPAAMIGLNVEAQRLDHWKNTNGRCNYQAMYAFFAPAAAGKKSIPFYNKFVEKVGDAPTSTASTYDAVYMIKEAVERAGTIENEAVIAELEKTDFQGSQGRLAFYPPDHKWPHDLQWGVGYLTYSYVQWRDGKMQTVWPDGSKLIGGIKYEGTIDYKLPPWMIKYWKEKK